MHIPVLLEEVTEGLDIKSEDVFLDATVGNGGHAGRLCGKLGKKGVLVGIDLDKRAIVSSADALKGCPSRVILETGSFRELARILKKLGVPRVGKALFDLGLRSEQIEESGRGFSFLKDEPLLMTFAANPGPEELVARDIVNDWSEEHIAQIIQGYGEERFARGIARAIVRARSENPIETTSALVAIIASAVPAWYRHRRIHFATKTFQALRIATNDELTSLTEALEGLWPLVAPGGRVAVISFHSLEDRIVKRFFKNKSAAHEGATTTKKPIIAKPAERTANPRSRSAKLRIIEKHATANKDN